MGLIRNPHSVLKNPKEMDTAVKPAEQDELLETIIERVNDKFHDKFRDGERVIIEALYRAVKNDQKLKKSAKNNDSQIFEQSIFLDFFHKNTLDNYEKSMKSLEKLFHDSDFYQAVMEVVAKVAYKDLRSEK